KVRPRWDKKTAPGEKTCYRAGRLILAAGGACYPQIGGGAGGYDILRSLGHTVCPLSPAIVPLKIKGNYIKELDGVRLDAVLKLKAGDELILETDGELLFTSYGVSGPAVLDISRAALSALQEGPALIEADFFPEYKPAEFEKFLLERAAVFAGRPFLHFACGLLNEKVMRASAARAGIEWNSPVPPGCVQELIPALKSFTMEVSGSLGFEDSMATAGGCALSELYPASFASKRVKGLYVTGELLNIDGDSGGFNLHLAWTSGILAGRAAARKYVGQAMRFGVLFLLLFFKCLRAQIAVCLPVLDIPRLDTPPYIDGILDEPIWQKAAKTTDFMQFAPKEGVPITEETTAYIGYDSHNLYIAFYARDSEPQKIRAHLSPRDQLFGDDWVGIILDTFGDQRRAYEFIQNPLGIQLDIFSSAGNEDVAPDFVWHSAGRVRPDGYVAEIRIPLKSLRFPELEKQNWRMYFLRNIERKNEKAVWPVFRANSGSLFSQMADLTGIYGITSGGRLELTPEFTASKSIPFESQDNSSHIGPWNLRAGANALYGITPNWTMAAAYNPDFSQVEADQPQIQVNQRFPLFFPEKRPFFMEGADLFSTPLRIVNTRTILDPQYGVKLTGKQAAWSGWALIVADRSRNDSTFNVFRLKRDIGSESGMGVVYSGRELGGGKYNRVAGVDGELRINKLYLLQFQGAGSFTKEAGGGPVEGAAYKISLQRKARHFGFYALYDDYHPDFQVDSGFFERVGIRRGDVNVWYKFQPGSGALLSWIPTAGYRRTYDHRGTLTDEASYAGIGLTFPLQTSFSLTYSPGTLERFGGIDFRKRAWGIGASAAPTSYLSGSVSGSIGEEINYDASPPFSGDSTQASLSLTIKPATRLSVRQDYLKSRLNTKAGERIFDENIWRTNARFQWSKEISSRMIYQYSTLRHSGFSSFLITYLLTPGTSFHAGYDVSFDGSGAALKKTNEVFFTKFSYLFRL
ncbi:MAG: aminoacetone oxidase family FAD-binding enzyme, partial [Elusimicrobiota bacterium]